MNGAQYFENIRLAEENPFLECKTTNFIKSCLIKNDHFINYNDGEYLTRYSNKYKVNLISYDSRPIRVILNQDLFITLLIEEQNNQNEINVGEKGVIYFITNYNDTENKFDPLDIEEKTKFNHSVYDLNNNEYNVSCKLWKPLNKSLVIICDLKEDLKYSEQKIFLKSNILSYNDYAISIESETSIRVKKYDYKFSFLYSDAQRINIDKNTHIYELKFKYESYIDNDLFYIKGRDSNYLILDHCETIRKELICQIEKEKIEYILTSLNEQFSFGIINYEIGAIQSDIVYEININYEDISKKDIYVTINNLLDTNIAYIGSSFAYKTTVENIDDIGNITTSTFNIPNDSEFECSFKKFDSDNLLLICTSTKEGDISI